VHAIDATATGEQPDRDRRIFLRADRGVPYGELMDVLEILRSGGYAKIALVALEAAAPQPTESRP
jgi:biopolymer transport protein ExbD